MKNRFRVPNALPIIYTVYKTTHITSGQYYIGVHKTTNPNDTYLGSGKRLLNAIRKYGKDQFSKSVIATYNSMTEAYNHESMIVNNKILDDPLCMNIKPGGHGGWDDVHKDPVQRKRQQQQLQTLHRDPKDRERKRKQLLNNKLFMGHKHSQETKDAIGRKLTKIQSGSRNSQFGTCWITRNQLNRKVKLEELEAFLLQGWVRGRCLKMRA